MAELSHLTNSPLWYERRDSNPYALRREILSLLSIPFLHSRILVRDDGVEPPASNESNWHSTNWVNHARLGAPEETRTPKIWFLRPTRIPIPSPGQISITWYHELDSNQPHTDFQSAALPDELPRQKWRKASRIELYALSHTFCFQDRVRPSLINLPLFNYFFSRRVLFWCTCSWATFT